MNRLYREESNHLDGPEDLDKPNVFLIGAFQNHILVAIGAVKILDDGQVYGEIKRLFVDPDHRGKGLSLLIMSRLESHLMDKNIPLCRLETGIYQPEAIRLYEKLAYKPRGPFGAYEPDPLSLFMEKDLLNADLDLPR